MGSGFDILLREGTRRREAKNPKLLLVVCSRAFFEPLVI